MHVKFKACHFVRKALSQMKVSYLDFISKQLHSVADLKRAKNLDRFLV